MVLNMYLPQGFIDHIWIVEIIGGKPVKLIDEVADINAA